MSAILRNTIAYAYDNLANVTFIVAGSEVGMLRDFLDVENPNSPLFGRYIHEIAVDRFSRELSREFLIRGFREEGLEPPMDAIDQAIDLFDGIVGWLVLFGKSYVDGVRRFEDIKEAAVKLAMEELGRLSDRERWVLKAIAANNKSWGAVRQYVAERYGVVLPKSTLTRIISKLERMSIIRDYEFQDPIYREAAKHL